MMNDLKPKTKISADEMKNISKETIDKSLDDIVFSFKLRTGDVVYITGQHNDKVKQISLDKPNKEALF